MFDFAKKIKEALYRELYLYKCAVCQKTLGGYGGLCLCEDCKKLWEKEKVCENDFIPPQSLSSLCYLGYYKSSEGSICRNLILSQKHYNTPCVDDFFAVQLAEKIRDKLPLDAEGEYIITCVPRSVGSMRKYGFNQSEYLAKRIAHYLSLPFYRIIRYAGEGIEQKNLTVGQRFENATMSYCIDKRYKEMLKNHSVILVDDVYTTGATMLYCSDCLVKAGAERVDGAVIARSIEKK